MTQFSIRKFGDNLPVTSIVAFSQVALGMGAGLLLSSHVKHPVRGRLGLGLAIGGVAALLPVIAGVVTNVRNRPSSSRRMRKQLDSIRRDTGLSENGHQF
jgi:hypothetical protein